MSLRRDIERLFQAFRPGDRMTAAEADSYRGSMERAAHEHAGRQAEHDATGVHEWLDITRFGSAEMEFTCRYCRATKTEPFPDCA